MGHWAAAVDYGSYMQTKSEDPRKVKEFKKVVERMLKTPPKPHKPLAKPSKKKPNQNVTKHSGT
jgi:hypothetical protein